LKILVTGGTGFIGSNLVRELVKNHEVTVIGTKSEVPTPGIKKFLSLHFNGIDWSQIAGMDVVFHQGANNNTLDQDKGEMWRGNVDAPIRLFCRALDGGCKKFVYASSTAVYGNSPAPYVEDTTPIRPLNPYAESKVAFDDFAMRFAKDNDVSVVGLRYCNVYGPGEDHKGPRASMIHQIAYQMLKGKSPKIFEHGGQKRDWIYVKDVVKANLLAMEFEGSDIFNCGFGKAVSFNDIVRLLNDILRMRLKPEYIPNPYKESYQTFTECDMKKARIALRFEPEYNVESGMSNYLISPTLPWGAKPTSPGCGCV